MNIPENNSSNRHTLAAYMAEEHGLDYLESLEEYSDPVNGDERFADRWISEYNYWETMFMEMGGNNV